APSSEGPAKANAAPGGGASSCDRWEWKDAPRPCCFPFSWAGDHGGRVESNRGGRNAFHRHSRESGNPASLTRRNKLDPAFAGVTAEGRTQAEQAARQASIRP